MFALIANDGGLIIPAKTKSSVIFSLVYDLANAVRLSNVTFTVRHRNESYVLNPHLMREFGITIIHCIYVDSVVSQVDGDFLKHLSEHYKVLLL